MNNYLTVLLYLKQFDGDGDFHELESVLPSLNLKQKESVFRELEVEGLIKLIGREQRMDSFIFEMNTLTGASRMTESPLNELNRRPQKPFSGKLTFKGSKYLKEELEMQQSGKYNINIGHSATANLILESNNSVINNSSQAQDKIHEIIKTLTLDETLDEKSKENAISVFQNAGKELSATNAVSKGTLKNLLSVASDISSIGSLVTGLIPILI